MSHVEFRHGRMAYRLTDVLACYVGVTLPALNATAAKLVLRDALARPQSTLASALRGAFPAIDGGRAGAPILLPTNLADAISLRIQRGQMLMLAYEPATATMLVHRIDEAPVRSAGSDQSLLQRVKRVIYGLDDVPLTAIEEKFQSEFKRFKDELTNSPALFLTMMAVIAAWAAAHAAPPVGLAFDAALFGLAVFSLGMAAFDWAARLAALIGRINAAKSDADYAACSVELARLIVEVGISVFMTILLRAVGKKIGSSVTQKEPELRTGPAQPARPVAPAKRNTGTTVLGHNPKYQALANKGGDRYFDIPSSPDNDQWGRLTKGLSNDEIFDKFNKPFIDRTIARGDNIKLSNSAFDAKIDSYFERELKYLYSKGFKPSADGMTLIKPGGP